MQTTPVRRAGGRRYRDRGVEFEICCTFCDVRGRKLCASCRKTILVGLLGGFGAGFAVAKGGWAVLPTLWNAISGLF